MRKDTGKWSNHGTSHTALSRLSFTGAMQAVEEFAATLRLESGRREE
jgi:hypothetical protein